jgi:hypothetical protein
MKELTYDQQVAYLVHLIQGNPADVKLLKQEYQALTGKRYNSRGK